MRKFTPSPNGSYYIDTSDEFQQKKTVCFAEEVEPHEPSDHEHGTVLEVETILENKSKFSKQDVHKAELARALGLQHVAGHLRNKQLLLERAQKNQLKNSPITPRDIRQMKEFLGPSVPGLKGKMARKQKGRIQPDVVPVPKHIQDYYQETILVIDIMHVNQIPFLITTSRHIHYHTASVLPSMKGDIIVSTLRVMFKFYWKNDF